MEKIKLISLNIWGLPWPFSPKLNKRFKDIIKFIKNEDPDVVVIQECWKWSYVRKLKKTFPNYHFSYFRKFLIHNQSGLVTMTKKKPKSVKFIMYQRPLTKRIEEFLSGKGILITELEIQEESVFVINTHTFSRIISGHGDLLLNQLKVLKKIVNEKGSMILAGDLNITPIEFLEWNKDELSSIIPKTPILDPKNPYRKKAPIHFMDRIEGNKGPTFLGVKTNPLKFVLNTQVISNIYLSDHQPIISEIIFFKQF